MSEIITMVAPVNIAVIKYWGKRDEELIIPLNDSVSATLESSIMCSKTSVCVSPQFTLDEIWLNGKKESFSNMRLQNCLKEIKERAAKEKSVSAEFLTWKVHVCSLNNFPTAAGLASSAAGYACLVSALAKLYKVTSDVSSIARLGSGSACRSVYGGFVRWYAGSDPLGADSVAKQVAPSSHWPEMRVLILVAGDTKKKVSSTIGMRTSVKTSELLQHRLDTCLPKRIDRICEAIRNKNFPMFAEITMKDSNQFHAICLDSYPPISYLNEVSFKIIELVHSYNDACGEVKVAYTFDAGPNACLYLLDKEVPKILSIIQHIFPTSDPANYVRGLEITPTPIDKDILSKLKLESQQNDLLKNIIFTKVGEGPTTIKGADLLNEVGEPLSTSQMPLCI